MSYQTVKVNCDARGVLKVTLSRPEVRNAFNEVMIAELTQVFSKEVTDKNVKLVVLCGDSSTFCAGGDLNWMGKAIHATRAENLEDTRNLSKLFGTMNECSKPLIGAVHGAAIGGGVGLVSVCDYVIAVESTQFSLSEVRLGIIPACIGPFVVAKIGPSYARALFISAERFSGTRAKEVGLVHELVKDQVELESALERLLNNMVQCGPHAMGHAKRLVLELSWPEKRARMGEPLEFVSQMLADVRVSPEGQEGIRAFLEKRKPSWIK